MSKKKNKMEMVKEIQAFFDQYNKLAQICKYKQYPLPDCMMDYHRDTIRECLFWVHSITSLNLWFETVKYWKQQSHERWLKCIAWPNDPTEFTEYNELKALVKELKSLIRWTNRHPALILKNAERFKKKGKQ